MSLMGKIFIVVLLLSTVLYFICRMYDFRGRESASTGELCSLPIAAASMGCRGGGDTVTQIDLENWLKARVSNPDGRDPHLFAVAHESRRHLSQT